MMHALHERRIDRTQTNATLAVLFFWLRMDKELTVLPPACLIGWVPTRHIDRQGFYAAHDRQGFCA